MTYRHAWMERRPEMSVNNSAFAFALRLFVGRCRVGELNQPWQDIPFDFNPYGSGRYCVSTKHSYFCLIPKLSLKCIFLS